MSYMGVDMPAGMHGYHPDAGCMDSVLLSNGCVPGDECSILDVAGHLAPGFVPGGMKETV